MKLELKKNLEEAPTFKEKSRSCYNLDAFEPLS